MRSAAASEPGAVLSPSRADRARLTRATSPRGWRSRRRLVVTGVQLAVLAVSAAAIAGLLRQVNPLAVVRQSGHASWDVLALAIALDVPVTLLRGVRTRVLLVRLGHRVPWRRLYGVNLAGQTLSWLTPAAAGDLARPWMWRSHDRVPVEAGVAAVLYERVVSIAMMGIVGGALAALIYLPLPAAAGVVAAAAALLVAPWWIAHAVRRAFSGGASRSRAGLIGGGLRAAGRLEELALSARVVAGFAGLTLAVFLVSGLQILLLAHGMGASVPLDVAVAAFCISQAAGSVSALPFGAGAGDVVTVALLQAGGAGLVGATAVDVLMRLVVTLPLGLAGSGALLLLGRPRLQPGTAAGGGLEGIGTDSVLRKDVAAAPAVAGRAA